VRRDLRRGRGSRPQRRVGRQPVRLGYLSFSSEFLKQNEITDYLVARSSRGSPRSTAVQRADILGARTFAMRIWLKPDRMAALNVSPHRSGRRSPPTTTWRRWPDQGPAGPGEPDFQHRPALAAEFEQMVVRESQGATVKLRDVADVVLGPRITTLRSTSTAQTAVFIGVWALPTPTRSTYQAGAGEMDSLAEGAARAARGPHRLRRHGIHPKRDQRSGATLLETVLIVVIVIFLFLGSLRSSLVPVVAIPTSLIGGVFLIQSLGFTINL